MDVLFFSYCSLSIYNMALNKGWMHKKNGEISFGLGLCWRASGGAIGCYFSSPFFMVSINSFMATRQLVSGVYQNTMFL